MFSALCRRLLPLALGTGFVFAAAPAFSALGDTASSQARHIATVFPGRMTGTPPEMLSADYLRQQFAQMGYQSDVRSFNTRYIYTDSNQRKNWHNATGSTVIAAHEGQSRQQIIIMAHLDTYAPQSDKDVENNLGGLTLQGIDDNAMGLGRDAGAGGAFKERPHPLWHSLYRHQRRRGRSSRRAKPAAADERGGKEKYPAGDQSR
jgi:alkaline phosphatase isozyme conversion protein